MLDGGLDAGLLLRRPHDRHKLRPSLVPGLASFETGLGVEQGEQVNLLLVDAQLSRLLERHAADRALARLQAKVDGLVVAFVRLRGLEDDATLLAALGRVHGFGNAVVDATLMKVANASA